MRDYMDRRVTPPKRVNSLSGDTAVRMREVLARPLVSVCVLLALSLSFKLVCF